MVRVEFIDKESGLNKFCISVLSKFYFVIQLGQLWFVISVSLLEAVILLEQ